MTDAAADPGTNAVAESGAGPAGRLLSVVIPVWNQERLIGDCLAAFRGTEAAGLEVIVVDDGSADGTAARVEALAAEAASRGTGAGIRLIRQPNAGPGAARNRGARAATGRWIAFHDSDDLWLPWTIPTLRRVLGAEPSPPLGAPKVLFLAARTFSDAAEVARWRPEPLRVVRHRTLLAMRAAPVLGTIASCNVVVERAAFLALGGFAEDVRNSEDTDLFYRAGLVPDIVSVAAPVMLGYRKGVEGSLTGDPAGVVRGLRYVLGRDRAGLYPGPRRLRRTALLRSAKYAAVTLFAEGHWRAAYAAWAAGAGRMARAGDWQGLVRLPLTPVLSLVRPQSYRFRRRPPV